MELTSSINDSEPVEVPGKGLVPLHMAFNYLLLGHHACSARGQPIVLEKQSDEFFFLRQLHSMSNIIRRDIYESFNHQANLMRSDAFTQQLEQLDKVYRSTDLTLPPGAQAYHTHGFKPASQERSTETLDRGDLFLSHIIERHNKESALDAGWCRQPVYVKERDAQHGAHLDFLHRTEGLNPFPRPTTYPYYPIPPRIPDKWVARKNPARARARAVASVTFVPRVAQPQRRRMMMTMVMQEDWRERSTLGDARADDGGGDAMAANLMAGASGGRFRAEAVSFEPKGGGGTRVLGSGALLSADMVGVDKKGRVRR